MNFSTEKKQLFVILCDTFSHPDSITAVRSRTLWIHPAIRTLLPASARRKTYILWLLAGNNSGRGDRQNGQGIF